MLVLQVESAVSTVVLLSARRAFFLQLGHVQPKSPNLWLYVVPYLAITGKTIFRKDDEQIDLELRCPNLSLQHAWKLSLHTWQAMDSDIMSLLLQRQHSPLSLNLGTAFSLITLLIAVTGSFLREIFGIFEIFEIFGIFETV